MNNRLRYCISIRVHRCEFYLLLFDLLICDCYHLIIHIDVLKYFICLTLKLYIKTLTFIYMFSS